MCLLYHFKWFGNSERIVCRNKLNTTVAKGVEKRFKQLDKNNLKLNYKDIEFIDCQASLLPRLILSIFLKLLLNFY